MNRDLARAWSAALEAGVWLGGLPALAGVLAHSVWGVTAAMVATLVGFGIGIWVVVRRFRA